MKITELARPGWGAVTLAALVGTAAGFAAGYYVARDPAAARRAAGRATQLVATGFGQATLWAAQMREHLGDLWAEAREGSLDAVDAADFARKAAAAAAAAGAAMASARAQASPGGATTSASKRRPGPDSASKTRTKPRPAAKSSANKSARRAKAAGGSRARGAPRRPVEPAPVKAAQPA